jgi:hypothetical protein
LTGKPIEISQRGGRQRTQLPQRKPVAWQKSIPSDTMAPTVATPAITPVNTVSAHNPMKIRRKKRASAC